MESWYGKRDEKEIERDGIGTRNGKIAVKDQKLKNRKIMAM